MTEREPQPDGGECEIVEIRFGGILIAAAVTEPDGTVRLFTPAEDDESPTPDRK